MWDWGEDRLSIHQDGQARPGEEVRSSKEVPWGRERGALAEELLEKSPI
jgi:hypothetical protein